MNPLIHTGWDGTGEKWGGVIATYSGVVSGQLRLLASLDVFGEFGDGRLELAVARARPVGPPRADYVGSTVYLDPRATATVLYRGPADLIRSQYDQVLVALACQAGRARQTR